MFWRVFIVCLTVSLSGCILGPPDDGEPFVAEDGDDEAAPVADAGPSDPPAEDMSSGRGENNFSPRSGDAGGIEFNDASDENGRPLDAEPNYDAGSSESDPDAELDDGRE